MNARPLLFLLLSILTVLPATRAEDAPGRRSDVVLVIHGGAGTISPEKITPEKAREYHAALADALRSGWEILANGGAAVDAIEATIRIMEDSPLFNAGRGAVFTSDGHNELDASIMDGATRNAGAIAAVRGVRHPVTLARAVMEHSPHVMLIGDGARQFALERHIEMADSAWFWTQRRWDALERARTKEKERDTGMLAPSGDKFGTVGAIALDTRGNIAAGTSTGGTTNKHWGRVGDSPIIGAGTYADNRTCGVSCTGKGELFIRGLLAYRVSVLVEQGLSIADAARRVIHDELVELGGEDTGGLVALDRKGNIAMDFNTAGMYRGFIRADGSPHTFLFRDGEGE